MNPGCSMCHSARVYTSTHTGCTRCETCCGTYCGLEDQARRRPVDMVNHPPHYTRGPRVMVEVPNLPMDGTPLPPMQVSRILECIEVIRHIHDMRLATAMKYIWRVAFGGKKDNREDIQKAAWYLNDWLQNPLGGDQ